MTHIKKDCSERFAPIPAFAVENSKEERNKNSTVWFSLHNSSVLLDEVGKLFASVRETQEKEPSTILHSLNSL